MAKSKQPFRAPKSQKKLGESFKHDVLSALGRLAEATGQATQIAQILGSTEPKSLEKTAHALEQLALENRVKRLSEGRYQLMTTDQHLVGRVEMTSTGAAYVVCEGSAEDIYIPPRRVRRALHGDTVKVLLYARRKGQKPEGEIVDIVERKKMEFVGILQMSGSFGFLVPDNRKMIVDIYIPKEGLNGAQDGQKCLAKITDWPEKASSPFGEIIQVLGQPGEHQVEIHSILAEFGLPYEFTAEVEAEAQNIPREITAEEVARRRDFRSITTFTIDPVDAKDFDDALSIRKLHNGTVEIGVHIADVTHYLQPGSELEREAERRGTSVYLVDRVVPMLPEVLSNDLCSLRPLEDKCCYSAVFEIDDQAKVKKRWFGRTLIHSNHRFAYEDAQAIIEGGEHELKEEVLELHRLATLLRQKRIQKGALLFDREEVKFKLDDLGNPLGIYFKMSKEANHLIEEFMLLANREVAEHIGKNRDGAPSDKTFVYRVHDDPDPGKLLDLNNFVKQFGYQLRLGSRKSTTDSLNQMLAEVKGKGEARMIETLALRSMAKAEYSTKNLGHYGLAFEYYTHFTSPIRRYPDVMAHRLLQHYLEGKSSPPAEPWQNLCKHSSEREKVAAEAERASIKYMQAKFMADRVGQSFTGIITGVTDWGVYVEITETQCEGMVRIRDFKDDYYVFDEKNYCIVGDAKGKSYRLGDSLSIRVRKVDVEKRQIDLELDDPYGRKARFAEAD